MEGRHDLCFIQIGVVALAIIHYREVCEMLKLFEWWLLTSFIFDEASEAPLVIASLFKQTLKSVRHFSQQSQSHEFVSRRETTCSFLASRVKGLHFVRCDLEDSRLDAPSYFAELKNSLWASVVHNLVYKCDAGDNLVAMYHKRCFGADNASASLARIARIDGCTNFMVSLVIGIITS